jgi:nucleosome binding factor SPN SPT16 subunit
MAEASYPTNSSKFDSVLSYYYSPLEDRNNKKITVLKTNAPNKMDFLTSVLQSHAHRLSKESDTTKLSARP